MTGNECRREGWKEMQEEALRTLSLPAANAFRVFQDSLTQITVDLAGKTRLVYPGVESVCRAHEVEWGEVFPFIKALEDEFLVKQNRPKKGP